MLNGIMISSHGITIEKKTIEIKPIHNLGDEYLKDVSLTTKYGPTISINEK